MEDLTGKQFGPYRVVGPLGEGGMAAVYKAYQANMDRYVALKVLPRYFASDPEFVGRFQQEAKVLAKLQHLHILAVHDFGESDGYTYIVMPFVESGTLSDLLTGEPLPLSQIKQIITQVAGALDYAHRQGIIHRDIKPSNILVDHSGNCLLTDFGIAKMVEGTTAFTQTGGIIGTPTYMSPEQIRGEQLDGRTDIYSLGVVLYEMATGRAPFKAETPPAVFVKHLHDPLPPPHIYNPQVPDVLERVVLKSLSKEREDRFETAGEMAAALSYDVAPALPTVQREGPAEPLPAAPRRMDATEAVRPPVRGKRPLPRWLLPVGAIVAVVILVIAAIAVLGAGSNEEPTPVALASPTERVVEPSPTARPPTATSIPPTATPVPLPSPTPEPEAVEEPIVARPEDPWGDVIIYPEIPILIGFVGDLSGPYASIGERQLEAVFMAVEDWNQIHGHPIEVAIEDSGCEPTSAHLAARAILQPENLVGVIGHTCSESCIEGKAVYDEQRVVTLTGSCTEDSLTAPPSPFFNRVALKEEWVTDDRIRIILESDRYIEFSEVFQERTGTDLATEDLGDVGPLVAYTHDAVRILLMSIEQVAWEDDEGRLHVGRQALAEAVRGTHDFMGVSGPITFSETGDRLPPAEGPEGLRAGDPWGEVIIPPGQPVRVAFAGSVTGPAAVLGEAQQTAFIIAIDHATDIHGFAIEPVFFDTACSPAEAVLVAERLAADTSVVGIVGLTCSEACEASIPILEESHLVSVSPTCGADHLTDRPWQLFNRVILRDSLDTESFNQEIESSDRYQEFSFVFQDYTQNLPHEIGGGGLGVPIINSHDATNLLIHAIRQVAVTDDAGNLIIGRQRLAEAVRSTNRFEGVTGSITFTEQGDRLIPRGGDDCSLKVGLLTDANGIDDAGFGSSAWQGMLRARDELGVCIDFQVGENAVDYAVKIDLFESQGVDMIVAAGFTMAEAVARAAEAYPDTNFVILDYVFDPPIANVQSSFYKVDQAAYLAGYVAAEWAHRHDPEDPQAGFLGGVELPVVQQFQVGYEAGIEHYNAMEWGANGAPNSGVKAPIRYAETFSNPEVGFILAHGMIDDGADVLFTAAGLTGNGALEAVRDRKVWGIGVDVDQYLSLPQVREILLTSVMKRLDLGIYFIIAEALEGNFRGGEIWMGEMSNDGVDLAPFHDFADQIPENVRAELERLREAIIEGLVDTGW